MTRSIQTLPWATATLAVACAAPRAEPAASASPQPNARAPVAQVPPTEAAPSVASQPAPLPSVRSGPPPRPSVVLTTYFEALAKDGTRRPLVSGGSLRSGDRFALLVGLEEALYLYVLYAGADGVAAVLYPESGEVRVPAGPARSFPEGLDFELDQTPGWERLLIVASREPLSRQKDDLATLVERVRATHDWPQGLTERAPSDPSAPPRPEAARVQAGRPPRAAPGATARVFREYDGPTEGLDSSAAGGDVRGGVTRGVLLTPAGSARLEVAPDASGVIAVPLFIRHLP